MTKNVKIIYEPHPVTPERKAELRNQGYKIIDAVYAPEGTKVAKAAGDGKRDLSKLKVVELKAELAELKVPFETDDNKARLVELLEAALEAKAAESAGTQE